MSTSQIERAAAEYREVWFVMPSLPDGLIKGYVVGQDDYYWLVLSTSAPEISIDTPILLHKGSVVAAILTKNAASQQHRPAIDKIGGSYLALLGKRGN
jgi:hypothetical protein